MSLDGFFADIGPFLVGRISHREAADRLYPGREGDDQDAKRLAIYANAYRLNSVQGLELGYPLCHQALLRRGDRRGWTELALRYIACHPQRHFSSRRNALRFPEFARRLASEVDLPRWLPDLADFELTLARTRWAPDEPSDASPNSGPLRLASTVAMRGYEHDVVEWLGAPDFAGDPPARRTAVLFWRDARLRARRIVIGRLEVVAMEAAVVGGPPDPAAAERLGATPADVEAIMGELRRAGVVMGEP
jgi:hypothetical protein